MQVSWQTLHQVPPCHAGTLSISFDHASWKCIVSHACLARAGSLHNFEAGISLLPHPGLPTPPAGETLALNIFEPRYRLLVRRVMQTSRRFGMATVHGSGHQLSDVACECEILDCQPQHDG